MELFTLTVAASSEEEIADLYRRIEDQLVDWCVHKKGLQLYLQKYPCFTEIRGIGNPGFPLEKSANQVYHLVASAVADHILSIKEEQRIAYLIGKDFAYEEPEDVKKIRQICHQILHEPSPPETIREAPDKKGRKAKIVEEMEQYLQLYPHLILEGWIHFRLHAYNNDLREVIEYAIDEFLMDKQYQEFISLLKYFVYMQETKIPAVHLMHRGGHEFTLLNEQMMPIDIQQFESMTLEFVDKEINFEDMVVSALIAMSPQNIYIHTRERETSIIKTIEQIFEERVSVCEYCPRCQPMLGGSNLHGKRSNP